MKKQVHKIQMIEHSINLSGHFTHSRHTQEGILSIRY